MTKKLTEEQQELFDKLKPLQKEIVINKIEGMSDIDAYKASHGKAKTDSAKRASVSEILSNLNVEAFLETIQEDRVNDAIMTREEAMERLSRIGRADCVSVFKTIIIQDKEGNDHKQTVWNIPDSEDLTPEQLSSIAEVSTGKDGLKIKQHSAPDAIKQLRQMEGWDKQEEKKDTEIHIHLSEKASKL